MAQIVQLYIDIASSEDWLFFEKIIHRLGFAFYLPPDQDKLPKTLEEVEVLLEHK